MTAHTISFWNQGMFSKLTLLLILPLVIISTTLSAQNIYREKTIDISQINPDYDYPILKFRGNFSGQSKLELFVTEHRAKGDPMIVDFGNEAMTLSITEEQIEGRYGGVFTQDVDLVRFKNEHYDQVIFERLFATSSRFYNPIKDDIVIDHSGLSDSRISYDLNSDGYPEIMGLNSDDIYEVYSYDDVWNPHKIFETEGRRYSVVLQADDDPQKEILLYGSGSSKIIDPFTQDEEEITLPFGATQNLQSVTVDGQQKLVVCLSGTKLRLYDVATNTIEKAKTISSIYANGSIEVFYTINNAGNATPYIAFLNNNLTILNIDLEIVLEVTDIENGPNDHNSRKIIIHDFDGDKNPNVLFVHNTKLTNFELSGIGNYYEAFHLTDQYPKDGAVVNDGSFYLNFSYSVAKNELKQYLSINDLNDTSKQLEYSLETDDNLLYVITPDEPLPSSEYALVIDKALRSVNNRRLDINKDQYFSGIDDKDYDVTFTVANGGNSLPSINILTQIPNVIYAETKFIIELELNSNSDSPIKSLKVGFENDVKNIAKPIDGVFNKAHEKVELELSAIGQSEGSYNYQLEVETYAGQKSIIDIPLQIVEVYGHPYGIRGVDVTNSNYQQREEASPFFEFSWERNTQVDLGRDQIKGENGYIYYMEAPVLFSRETNLKKIDLETNTLQWEIEFGDKFLSDVTIKDGYLYYTIHEEGDLYMNCLNASDGSKVWSSIFDDTGSITGTYFPVMVYEDYVLLPYSEGIICFNRWSGKSLWKKHDDYMRTNAVVHDGIIYSSDQDYIYSFDIATGRERYRFGDDAVSSYGSTLMLDSENNQLVFDTAGKIYAFDFSSWQTNWVIESIGHKDLVMREGFLFYQTSFDEVYKADLRTGVVDDKTIQLVGNSEQLFLFGDYLAVTNSWPSATSFYDAESLEYKGGVPFSGQISMVDNYMILNNNNRTSVYEMELRCYEDEFRNEDLCKGDSITIYGKTYTYSGSFIDTIETAELCHTVLNLSIATSGPSIRLSVVTNSTGNDNGRIELRVEQGEAPYTYEWSNGATTPIIENLAPGEYSVTITDADGCQITDLFVIENKQCVDNGGDADEDGYCADVDCNDNNSFIHPDQNEDPYNGIDDDCNPETLDDDLDQDGFSILVDCDDQNPSVNPGQIEIPYNGIDDDCNPLTLEDDLDQDGYPLLLDCDDSNPSINPAQAEVPYNGIDEDCNSVTLDDDLDRDGFLLADDCDDNNALVHPDQTEGAYNGIDDDCNPLTPDDDLDSDGYLLVDDCDDENAMVNPGMVEEPYNGLDDDCDAATLDDDLDADGFMIADDCDDTNQEVNPGQVEKPYNSWDDDCNVATLDDDLDQDGFLLSEDCDDQNEMVNPDQVEEPYNNLDDDCNPMTLEDDLDQDGFLFDYDCDDRDSTIYPGAPEIANNGIDEDCDGADFISYVHELSYATINIYPNPATDLINIKVEGLFNYQIKLYDLQGRLMISKSKTPQLLIGDLHQGIYLLVLEALESGETIVERIIKRE